VRIACVAHASYALASSAHLHSTYTMADEPDSLVARRSRRSTAGNRLPELLLEAALDVAGLQEDLNEEDVDFVVDGPSFSLFQHRIADGGFRCQTSKTTSVQTLNTRKMSRTRPGNKTTSSTRLSRKRNALRAKSGLSYRPQTVLTSAGSSHGAGTYYQSSRCSPTGDV
jgi:hypothetical protein